MTFFSIDCYTQLNKLVPYYYDCDERPATHSSIDRILDSAFGSSSGNDINYLYIASHGYSGTSEEGKIVYADTGLVIGTNNGVTDGVYKFTDFAKKLTGYSGQFVIIIDCCFAENLYTTGLAAYPGHQGRFTVFCSAAKNEYASGAIHTQFYTSNMVNALTYKSASKKYAADANKDGFITVKELHSAVKWKEMSSVHTYGNTQSQIFQFGYVKLSKQSVTVNLTDTKTYRLGSSLKKYNCTTKQKPKWKSSNTAVATVDKNGKVTLKKAGTAVVTAYLADSNGNMCLGSESSCTITVKAPTIKLNKTSVTLYKGQTEKLTAIVTGTKKKVTWSSSKPSVVSVKNGKITAKKPGTAIIKAKVGNVYATCTVTVKKPTILLNKTSATMTLNQPLY